MVDPAMARPVGWPAAWAMPPSSSSTVLGWHSAFARGVLLIALSRDFIGGRLISDTMVLRSTCTRVVIQCGSIWVRTNSHCDSLIHYLTAKPPPATYRFQSNTSDTTLWRGSETYITVLDCNRRRGAVIFHSTRGGRRPGHWSDTCIMLHQPSTTCLPRAPPGRWNGTTRGGMRLRMGAAAWSPDRRR